jgi:dUTP pyrophosphatase
MIWSHGFAYGIKKYWTELANYKKRDISITMVDEHTDSSFDAPGFECPDCHRTFKTTGALREHSRTHRSSEMTVQPQNPPLGALDPDDPPSNTAPQVDVTVKVKKLRHYGNLPELKRATEGSAGFDLYAAITDEVAIGINHWQLIPTGLCVEIPVGWVGLVAPRSGLAANNGITVLNTPGVIDSDYRGELLINLINNTTTKFRVLPGMRIGQLLIVKQPSVHLEYVDELSDTKRGTKGFGSTGI